MYCRKCGNKLDYGHALCLDCGTKLGEGEGYCQNCGVSVAVNANHCHACGFELKKVSKSDAKRRARENYAKRVQQTYTPPQQTYTPPQQTYTPPQQTYTPPQQTVQTVYTEAYDYASYGFFKKLMLIFVCFTIGYFGVHNFLMGEVKKGIFRLVTSFFYIGIFIVWFDLLKMILGIYKINRYKLI